MASTVEQLNYRDNYLGFSYVLLASTTEYGYLHEIIRGETSLGNYFYEIYGNGKPISKVYKRLTAGLKAEINKINKND